MTDTRINTIVKYNMTSPKKTLNQFIIKSRFLSDIHYTINYHEKFNLCTKNTLQNR